MRVATIVAGKEKQLLRRHPWVLPRAVGGISGTPEAGLPDVVCVVDHDGKFIAYGWMDADAATPIRLVSWERDAIPDSDWLAGRLAESVRRRDLLARGFSARRLVFGESDGLPGVAADQYDRYLVIQLSTRAAIDRRAQIVEILLQRSGAIGARLVTDRTQASMDRLPALDEWVGQRPDDLVIITEGATRFAIDLKEGQKTGFYLDQRDNRSLLSELAEGRRMLDAFCYSGAFALRAKGAQSRVCVDSAAAAGDLVRRNVSLNDAAGVTFVKSDVFAYLRDSRGIEPFDLIVLDPPKMAKGRREVEAALRAYKDMMLHALRLLSPDGIVAIFSCSASIGWDELHRASAWAALDAGRSLRALRWLSQSGDHPVLSSFPESHYLRGILWTAQ